MPTNTDRTDLLRSILVMLATLATVAFNVLAAARYINNVTPAEISARYPTHITAAGYAFSISSLIYLGRLAFSIYHLGSKTDRLRATSTLYIASCVLNCAW